MLIGEDVLQQEEVARGKNDEMRLQSWEKNILLTAIYSTARSTCTLRNYHHPSHDNVHHRRSPHLRNHRNLRNVLPRGAGVLSHRHGFVGVDAQEGSRLGMVWRDVDIRGTMDLVPCIISIMSPKAISLRI